MERRENFLSEILMDYGRVVFGPIIAFVGGPWAPVDAELFLRFSVSYPMVFHVHGFCCLWLDFVVGDTMCCGVVRLDWGGRLGMAHFFKQVALGHCVFCINEQPSDFGLCC